MATEGDNDSIDKPLVTMDILVKHFEKQKNKHVNDTEFHDAIMRAWYAFDKYYSLTDEVPVYAAALLSILQGESAILMRTGRGLGLDQCYQSSSVFGKRSMPATRKLQA